MKIVIRAGGVGSRLWPVSRSQCPKQFHAFASQRTMIQDAVERVAPLADASDIFVSTTANAVSLVTQQLPKIRKEHIIVEPARRDTAAAIGLEALYVAREDPDAVIASLGSDHLILKPDEFCRLLRIAETVLNRYPEYLVTLGVMPTYAETGYGYIHKGRILTDIENEKVYLVDTFTEKPDFATAKTFLTSGEYLWNSNMFAWRVQRILALFAEYCPAMYRGLLEIREALGTSREQQVVERVYPTLEKTSIDYAIIEKTQKIAVIPADIGWTDIGNWRTLYDVLPKDASGNVLKGNVRSVDTHDTFVFVKPEKLVATVGLHNVVIVDTDDALLVCDQERAQDVKKIVEALTDGKQDTFL
ncbi:MAG: hypothetical protein A3B74_00125 [Candidatus Kerfeldbacteria bacterium RIFCSPHIGHO2_02_FULL_42_14]|uniref:mannose-1-phosphate guanylyltransferase n=1 Tax=Candidatus Kerfeldbacteria bacterium RIFCSPHIGHO2_02_FULL_42_14 TaxID=1798540 RepID=A0A1G2AQQ8_9BACT|nr:MAG: hypothetical protein A3B74_00125 [Candidatus Kerfeldbacteria bacterium RIFCSPHIGHO2_02_FULL_42_14]OGY81317.1 MAG: hypothetical protein A3E60_02615 [Candidatus Kerfeldbacteria bacterium RIFCSPHIGHO2_12_FULL_42_13]OGY83591.1 MAG: hypothetical protein A3I91_03045 [Candidatus Kerfeldbacteria bacterium RIFCSPLOWO2_02_FULL_42_19]OGY86695.1 MAG: hypothetical protein A3G01_00580 [Candidatus Kerfeldbacteria bacterium RIFCSPLOWO2_12_FULL_43_9]